jgi:hypothetical protein
MRLAHPVRHLRRGAAFAILGVVLAASALSLNQCRMVDERLTGVSIDRASPDKCMAKCNQAYNDSIRAESDLHVTYVHSCASDSVCLALEGMRHEAAVGRIQAGRKACHSQCHHQGSGGGGR